MPGASHRSCPSCGAPASGRFCASCGAALGANTCGSCGATLAPGARFCGACGTATSGGARPGAAAPSPSPARPSVLPFALVGLAVVVALVVSLLPDEPVPAANAPFAGGAPVVEPPPLLDGLSARDRFDTLYNRTMRASERGDGLTAAQYGPQALEAYASLEAVDADARYHAAMIRLHTGDIPGAQALADTILQAQPTHLFGFVLRGTVARSSGDDPGLASALADFLRHYDAETASGRAEYGHHNFILNQFVTEARARQGG